MPYQYDQYAPLILKDQGCIFIWMHMLINIKGETPTIFIQCIITFWEYHLKPYKFVHTILKQVSSKLY